jgi:hypothetical protein
MGHLFMLEMASSGRCLRCTCLKSDNHVGGFDVTLQIPPSESGTKMCPVGRRKIDICTNAFQNTASEFLGHLNEKRDVPLVFATIGCDNEGIFSICQCFRNCLCVLLLDN